MKQTKPFEVLIFDLDDTLLDTAAQITPKLFRLTSEAMIQAGLNATVEQCVEYRKEFFRSNPRERFFESLIAHFGSKNPAGTLDAAVKVFYSAPLTMPVSISQKTRVLLSDLSQEHSLFLVTAGDPDLQKSKVRRLEIESFFKQIFFVQTRRGQQKRTAFFEILNATGAQPSRILSVGNRIDAEISQSKDLEIKTCLILNGEYQNLKPLTGAEVPDFTITNLEQLREICEL